MPESSRSFKSIVDSSLEDGQISIQTKRENKQSIITIYHSKDFKKKERKRAKHPNAK
jgi:hypothetical protein